MFAETTLLRLNTSLKNWNLWSFASETADKTLREENKLLQEQLKYPADKKTIDETKYKYEIKLLQEENAALRAENQVLRTKIEGLERELKELKDEGRELKEGVCAFPIFIYSFPMINTIQKVRVFLKFYDEHERVLDDQEMCLKIEDLIFTEVLKASNSFDGLRDLLRASINKVIKNFTTFVLTYFLFIITIERFTPCACSCSLGGSREVP